MENKPYSRRDFLRDSALAAGALYMGLSTQAFGTGAKNSKVILVRNKNVLDDLNQPKQAIVGQMLDDAVTTLLGVKNPVDAWKQLLRPEDMVGIKTNVWRYLPTTTALEQVIKERVLATGVPDKNISIRDRGLLSDEIFTNATALINARPLRTHHWSGVGSLIKNYIMFVEQPWQYHPNSCADLAAIWKLPLVKDKTRLNILVLFSPLFHGIGPHHFNPEYVWNYCGLLVGFDPVAIDSVGVRLLMAKRKAFFKEERPLNPPPQHVFLADTRHHLGTAAAEKIELVKLGWQEDCLI